MITVTSTANGVSVDFNSYYPSRTDAQRGYWSKGMITRVIHHGSYVEVKSLEGDWLMNVDESDSLFGVALIDGQAPVSIDDLYNKIIAVVG